MGMKRLAWALSVLTGMVGVLIYQSVFDPARVMILFLLGYSSLLMFKYMLADEE